MRLKLFIVLLCCSGFMKAQHFVSGTVVDKSGQPISGANVYLEGTYDGATTDAAGNFSFSTADQGLKTLIVSFVSFESFRKEMEVAEMQNLKIRLRDDVTALDAVVISAGTFSAGDNSKVTVLKPLDVVTTAGVAGDFIAALQTLPGTQPVGEDGRLFVRGGTAAETNVYIDGLRVFQPYTASATNLPSRGRYSPFLFDGITFSTGGYSAEYGQALSGVLLLNTIHEPEQTETNISIMSVGGGVGHTQKWENSSVSLSSSYINLSPYLELIPNNEQADFIRPYESLGGEGVYRRHFKNGTFKWYAAYEHTTFSLLQPDLNRDTPTEFSLTNNNFYTNLSYKASLQNGWTVNPGLSTSYAQNEYEINDYGIKNEEIAGNLKLKLSKRFNNRFRLNFGSEYIFQNFSEENEQDLKATPSQFAFFAESDLIFSKSFALKLGVRSSYIAPQENYYLSPRLSMAIKAGQDGQFSFAYGTYLQQPGTEILKFDAALEPEQASHFILNYQWTRPGYTLRAETYYKDYRNLIRYNTTRPTFESRFNNSGDGFAQGFDLFYRDDKSVEKLQYWLSYSYIDSKRIFSDYPVSATPQFVAKHAASLVTKYWVEQLHSQTGFTYSWASGRPFEDPNTPGFMNRKTRDYNSLSFNWAYLLSPQKILYLSVSNLLGSQNVFNYEYASTADSFGNYSRRAITPAADRFFFVGFFWTISADKSSNQLDTL